MEMVKTFIKNTQKEIQDNTFKPRKCTGARGLGMFSLLPLYGCRFKSIQINGQALQKTSKSCTSDKESIPIKATDDDLTMLCSKFSDFLKQTMVFQMTSAIFGNLYYFHVSIYRF